MTKFLSDFSDGDEPWSSLFLLGGSTLVRSVWKLVGILANHVQCPHVEVLFVTCSILKKVNMSERETERCNK